MQRMMFLFLALALVACGKYSKDEMAQQDKAFGAMMEAHDRAMPRMGEIEAVSGELRTLMADSTATDSVKAVIMKALERLEKADEGMMTWMNELKTVEQVRENMDHAAIMEYYKNEETKIKIIENDIAGSISNGQALVDAMKAPQGGGQ
jgi:hypothetical protein